MRGTRRRRRYFACPVLLVSLVCLALMLPSCKMGPDYTRPEPPKGDSWRMTAATAESIANLPWWELLKDQELQKLVHAAILENLDLRIAAANIEDPLVTAEVEPGDLLILFLDHILHAGDVGGDTILGELELIAPVQAVYGNCDPPWDPALAQERIVEIGVAPVQAPDGSRPGHRVKVLQSCVRKLRRSRASL